jgi:hypothetical protein
MTALCMRGGLWLSLGRWLAVAFLCAAIVPPAFAAEPPLVVVLDQAKIIHLPPRVSTIVVGNPLIADISVQAGGIAVITGKGYGRTNIIAMDRAGSVLMERSVQVQGPRENVVIVYRGVDRETYSCTPKCERRITLGDVPAFFDVTLTQTGNRSGQATSGSGAAVAR